MTGSYDNPLLGSLASLSYRSSTSLGDVTNLALYGSDNAAALQSTTFQPYDVILDTSLSYFGSATFVTSYPGQSALSRHGTPSAVVEAAQAMVGKVANQTGCWIMASTIAAEAGASLPISSALAAVQGQNNGPWIVAYDGTESAHENWADDLRPGDIVSFITPQGGGHITTISSGSGRNSRLIDNAWTGYNSADDGHESDLIVAPAHSFASEFTGVPANTVVVYRLDVPIVQSVVSDLFQYVAPLSARSLGSLATAGDPGGCVINAYQVYDTGLHTSLEIAGMGYSAKSEGSALTVSSLEEVSLRAGAAAEPETLYIRASNDDGWGDWTGIEVGIKTPPPIVGVRNDTQGISKSAYLEDIGSGGPSYLQWKYIAATSDNVAVSTEAPNVFLVGGSGTKALSVSSGQNVLNGGSGSSFLTGGTGNDTFFVDLRQDAPVWDTIRNFHTGDTVTLWGWDPGRSTMTIDPTAGAAGSTGATLRIDDGFGHLASVTFTGASSEQVSHFQKEASSLWAANPYLTLTNAGV